MKVRIIIVTVLITVGFLAVAYRLVNIMIINHEAFVSKALKQHVKVEQIPVKRGIIYDAKGRELAINLDTETLYANPSLMVALEQSAMLLSEKLNKPAEAIKARFEANKKFALLERKLSPEQAEEIKRLNLRGIGFYIDPKRVYPKGKLASHVIGYTDIDNHGLEGVEKVYDEELMAEKVELKMHRDAKGNVLSDGKITEIRGNNITLTIDEALQRILERNIDEAVSKWSAVSAVGIMMNPHTGELLAMVSRPAFDPNKPGAVKPEQRRNRAITDTYEPGSTFKIVAGIAALQEGLVKPETKFDCSAGSIEVGGKSIKDAHRHGVLTFKEVIQKSSNVGTIMVAQRLGKNKLYEYIRLFGFGQKTGIDLLGEVSGLLKPVNKWSGTSIGAIAIGQEIGVTPLQILRAYAVVANGGLLVKPHVVSKITSPDGTVIYKADNVSKRILNEEHTKVFRDILKSVTEDGGTAKTASVDGNQVAGKTGTAQIYDPKIKSYSKDRYISSFVGFVPADNPKIAMIIVIYEPKGQTYGGVVAGPVFRQVANEALSYLSVPREDAEQKGLIVISDKVEPKKTGY